jgi:hypothetical protein
MNVIKNLQELSTQKVRGNDTQVFLNAKLPKTFLKDDLLTTTVPILEKKFDFFSLAYFLSNVYDELAVFMYALYNL